MTYYWVMAVLFIIIKAIVGVPFSSLSRARVPCAEAPAVDLGLTPGPGPFAVCYSPYVSCHIFSCTVNEAIKGQKIL